MGNKYFQENVLLKGFKYVSEIVTQYFWWILIEKKAAVAFADIAVEAIDNAAFDMMESDFSEILYLGYWDNWPYGLVKNI